MRRERDSIILNKLAEQLEEILKRAKANDLCHLIEPIEETILKVKELNRTTKVECEHKGECNSTTGDLQMACSCNDWGPDILGPNGKWICEECGEDCSCSETWDSLINIPKGKFKKEDDCDDQKQEKICEKNENSRKTDDCCICGSSKNMENELYNETLNPSKMCIYHSCKKMGNNNKKSVLIPSAVSKPKYNSRPSSVSILFDQRSSGKKDFVKSTEEIFKSTNSITGDRQAKLSSREIKSERKDSTNLSKCQNCKCANDEKGKLIKTEECKIFSERRQQLIAKGSRSKSNSNYRKNDPIVFKFANEEKSTTEAKSSGQKVLRSPQDSRDQRCWEGMEDEKKHEQRDQETSKCSPKSSEQCSKKLSPELQTGKKRIDCEKPEKPLKCSEIAGRVIFQKDKVTEESDGPKENIQRNVSDKYSPPLKKPNVDNRCSSEKKSLISGNSEDTILEENFRKTQRRVSTACKKCSPSIKRPTSGEIGCQCSPAWTEKIKQDYKVQRKSSNCPESEDRTATHGRDGQVEKPIREMNTKQKMQVEKAHCSSDFYSSEKLCPCGCGYFIEGVSETRPVSCNKPKNPRQEISMFKNTISRSQSCDCEGSCEWCSNV